MRVLEVMHENGVVERYPVSDDTTVSVNRTVTRGVARWDDSRAFSMQGVAAVALVAEGETTVARPETVPAPEPAAGEKPKPRRKRTP